MLERCSYSPFQFRVERAVNWSVYRVNNEIMSSVVSGIRETPIKSNESVLTLKLTMKRRFLKATKTAILKLSRDGDYFSQFEHNEIIVIFITGLEIYLKVCELECLNQ